MTDRAAIVAEARTWLGTPYHNCAAVKGAGVDCGMLILRVFADLKLIPFFDPRPYAPDWHLHRAEEKYIGYVRKYAREAQEPQAGDVALFRYGRCYSHGAIVTRTAPLTIVHAFAPAGLVLEEEVARNSRLSDAARSPRFFDVIAQGPQEARDCA